MTLRPLRPDRDQGRRAVDRRRRRRRPARRHRSALADSAREEMVRSAALVDGFIAGDRPVYGVTTGFGSLADTVIPHERTRELQVALIRSHAAGMGEPVEREVVRAMLLLPRQEPGDGAIGRPPVARRPADGAAQRRPDARRARARLARRERRPGAARPLRAGDDRRGPCHPTTGPSRRPTRRSPRAGLEPVVLRAKEGLALINGTDGILGMLVAGDHRPRRSSRASPT